MECVLNTRPRGAVPSITMPTLVSCLVTAVLTLARKVYIYIVMSKAGPLPVAVDRVRGSTQLLSCECARVPSQECPEWNGAPYGSQRVTDRNMGLPRTLGCAQDAEVRGDRMPCVAGAEHPAAEHHLELAGHDEQLLVPLQGEHATPCSLNSPRPSSNGTLTHDASKESHWFFP